MASAGKRRRNPYATCGNVAYAPGYDGSAVRALPREEVVAPRPKARPRRQAQALTRPRVRVREQEQVSVFAVVGFLAVAVCHELDHLDGILYVDKMIEDVTGKTEEAPKRGEDEE